jgi:transcriptional regulator GlxA family with amidase domain
VRGIGFVVYPGFSVMVLTVVNVFEIANTVVGSPPYELHFLSEKGGKVKTSSGMMLESEAFTDMPFDTLIVSAARFPKASTPGMIAFLREAPKRHRRIAAICTGAFLLAEAGLLDGRQATTHWLHAPKLGKLFPKVKIDQDRIFTNEGSIWTTAGGAACLDLGLALIENDLGPELARSVARELILYHRRGGAQSQFSALLEMSPKSDRIQMALTYARENLHRALTVPELADAARLSPRQFSRSFQAETGQSPAKAIEQSRHPIDVVARQSGFSDRDHMRRAFVRAFGHTPQALRRMTRAP